MVRHQVAIIQDTYKREEQRRFEISLAHWDLPVSGFDKILVQ
jgi:hypothetical protein